MAEVEQVEKERNHIQLKGFKLKLNSLNQGKLRLDASYYTQTRFIAGRSITDMGYKILTICPHYSNKIFNPPPLRRHFSVGSVGVPYLMPSELFSLKIKPSKYVHDKMIENVSEWYVKEGWILVTQSGLVGVPLITTKSFEKFIISQNLIRVIPEENAFIGYVYAYLSTWIGQALLRKDQYGVTVEHIESRNISEMPIPDLPEETQLRIHNNIMKAYNTRERARELLDSSEKQLIRKLGLEDTPIETASESLNSFIIKSSELNYRLDASFHETTVRYIEKTLSQGAYSTKMLMDIAKVYAPNLFKRIYVDKKFGLPLLQGRDVVNYRPTSLKYISKKIAEDPKNSLIILKNWILITGRGTVGKICVVPPHWDGWAASHNLWRIIPNENESHPGYIALFLSSNYGYTQLLSKACGMVVDVLTPQDTERIIIPSPPYEIQKEIGEPVMRAYALKEKANFIEDATIRTLEDMILKHRKDSPNAKHEIETYNETFELIGTEDFDKAYLESKRDDVIPYQELQKEIG